MERYGYHPATDEQARKNWNSYTKHVLQKWAKETPVEWATLDNFPAIVDRATGGHLLALCFCTRDAGRFQVVYAVQVTVNADRTANFPNDGAV